jgi:hypothetical protein
MRSNEAREIMVSRVQDAYAKWPSFDDLPEVESFDRSTAFGSSVNKIIDPNAYRADYVKALYAAAWMGEVIGRCGMAIAVRKITEAPLERRTYTLKAR